MATYTFNTSGVGVRELAALSLAGSSGGTDFVWVNNTSSTVTVDYVLSAATLSVNFNAEDSGDTHHTHINEVSVRERGGTRAFTAIFPPKSGGLMTLTGTGNFTVARPVPASSPLPVKTTHRTGVENGEVFHIEAVVA